MHASKREKVTTIAGAMLLLSAATFQALRFRALPPAVDLRQMTWDAAQHALIGLDLYDLLRRFDLAHFLLRMQEEHWWPPLFGILSLPAYALGGRRLSSPSLVSLASYCAIPAVAWILVRQVSRAVPLLALAFIAVFYLRSPEFIEMSAWSMLEAVATLFALLAFGCFAAGPHLRARNWAYGFAGASTLLKYHYGFFLLVTLGVATIAELEPSERRILLDRARRPIVWVPIAIVLASFVVGAANLIWLTYVVVLIVMLARRAALASLPLTVRNFFTKGVIWPAVWCIDPANVHAWYRELRVRREAPSTTLSIQLETVARYLVHDFSLGPIVLTIVIAGLALAFIEAFRRRNIALFAVAMHAVWPVALMSLSKYLVESRFLVTAIACLYAASAAGWVLNLARWHMASRTAVAFAIIGVLAFDLMRRGDAWRKELIFRRVYCYASSDPPDQFVRATVQTFTAGVPVFIALPGDISVVGPTIRLGLRVAMPDVAPHSVVVEEATPQTLSKYLRRFRGGLIGVEPQPALNQLIAASGLSIMSETPGPSIPKKNDRALHVLRVR